MSEYNIQMNKYNALNAEYDQLYPQPMKHASTHAKDGSDPITPSSIGAAELGADGKVLTSQLPSMEVDAYTKVQTLSDTTKTLFGLDATAVPDDALALLSRFQSGLGNEYVWEKRDSTSIVGYVNSPDPNAYPPSVPDGYTYTALGQLGAGVRMDLLWENASPTSAFAAQSITVDNVSNYQLFMIESNNYLTNMNMYYDFISFGKRGYLLNVGYSTSWNPASLCIERSLESTNTGFTIGDSTINGGSTDGKHSIPTRIFGIKGITTAT